MIPAVPMYWRAEIARMGGHDLYPYEDPERGWVDPLNDPEMRGLVRAILQRMFKAASDV